MRDWRSMATRLNVQYHELGQQILSQENRSSSSNGASNGYQFPTRFSRLELSSIQWGRCQFFGLDDTSKKKRSS